MDRELTVEQWMSARKYVRWLLLGCLAATLAGNIDYAWGGGVRGILWGVSGPLCLWMATALLGIVKLQWWEKLPIWLIAGVTGWVSYWHLVAGLKKVYGVDDGHGNVVVTDFFDNVSVHISPIVIDALVVISAAILRRVNAKIVNLQSVPAVTEVSIPTVSVSDSAPVRRVSMVPPLDPDTPLPLVSDANGDALTLAAMEVQRQLDEDEISTVDDAVWSKASYAAGKSRTWASGQREKIKDKLLELESEPTIEQAV